MESERAMLAFVYIKCMDVHIVLNIFREQNYADLSREL